MIPVLSSASCWVILVSALITTVLAVWGLLSPTYHETLPENVALCVVAGAGVVVVLQIHALGAAQWSGLAMLSASVALYAVAKVLKALSGREGEGAQ